MKLVSTSPKSMVSRKMDKVYMDKTFCSMWQDCEKGSTCPDASTRDVWNSAREAGLPVMLYATQPECFEWKK